MCVYTASDYLRTQHLFPALHAQGLFRCESMHKCMNNSIRMCMYMYMYICVYIYLYIYIYIYIYIYTASDSLRILCLFPAVHAQRLFRCESIHKLMNDFIRMCMYMCMYICVYIYICIRLLILYVLYIYSQLFTHRKFFDVSLYTYA